VADLLYQCTVCKNYHATVSLACACKETCLTKTDDRNVVDLYKYWKIDAIKADLDKKRHNFSVLITNHFSDFNIGSVIRNANAFLAREIFILGRRKYDNRGAVGTQHYEKIIHIDNLDQMPKSYFYVGFDDLPNAKEINDFTWPRDKHVVLCFGQETVGLSENVVKHCNEIVYIKQYGSVRSLNVGCASAIAMFDYTNRTKMLKV